MSFLLFQFDRMNDLLAQVELPALHMGFQLHTLHQHALNRRHLLHCGHNEDSLYLGTQKLGVICLCIDSTRYPAFAAKD